MPAHRRRPPQPPQSKSQFVSSSSPTSDPKPKPKKTRTQRQLSEEAIAQLEGLYSLTEHSNLREVTAMERLFLQEKWSVSEAQLKEWWRKRREQQRAEDRLNGIFTDARMGKMRKVDSSSSPIKPSLPLKRRLGSPIQLTKKEKKVRFQPRRDRDLSSSPLPYIPPPPTQSDESVRGPTFVQSSSPVPQEELQSSSSTLTSLSGEESSLPPSSDPATVGLQSPPHPPEKPDWFDLFFDAKELRLVSKMKESTSSGEGENVSQGMFEGSEEVALERSTSEDLIHFDTTQIMLGKWIRARLPTAPSDPLSVAFHPSIASFAFSFSHDHRQYRILLPVSSIKSLRVLNDPRSDRGFIYFVLFPPPSPHKPTPSRFSKPLFQIFDDTSSSSWTTISRDFTENQEASKSQLWCMTISQSRKAINSLYAIEEKYLPEFLGRVWWGIIDLTYADENACPFEAISFDYPITSSSGEERWNPLKRQTVLLLEFRNHDGRVLWLRNLGFERMKEKEAVEAAEREKENTPSPLKKRCWSGLDSTLAPLESSDGEFDVDVGEVHPSSDPPYDGGPLTPEMGIVNPFLIHSTPTPSPCFSFSSTSSSEDENDEIPSPSPAQRIPMYSHFIDNLLDSAQPDQKARKNSLRIEGHDETLYGEEESRERFEIQNNEFSWLTEPSYPVVVEGD